MRRSYSRKALASNALRSSATGRGILRLLTAHCQMSDDYFFVTPSFLRGAARVLDLSAGLRHESYRLSRSGDEADARALASDWAAVGYDLQVAREQFAEEHGPPPAPEQLELGIGAGVLSPAPAGEVG